MADIFIADDWNVNDFADIDCNQLILTLKRPNDYRKGRQMRVASIAVLASLCFPGVSTAKEPTEDKVVCKRQEDADTGSHFRTSKKICMKRSEWKELEDIKDRVLREMGDRGGANPDGVTSSSAPQ